MSAANDNNWQDSARKAADAALDIYDRDSVEYELALYLSRALRELSARD